MYRDNSLKQRLRDGRKALGAWLFTDSPVAAEILGQAGYDFVLIDHEHGFGGLTDAVRQLQALQAFPATVLMRVPWNDQVYIKRALDIGVEGLMVPMIETAADARAAVAACRYPPEGVRGAATSVIRASEYGRAAADYLETANERLFIMCQIESARAVANIPEIAATDGVDALFVGPNDLAASLGHRGAIDHPEVAALLAQALDAARASRTPLGIVPHAGLGWPELFARGYDIVAGGSDISLLRSAAAEQVAAHRRENG